MKETFAEFQNDWPQIMGGFNWYTFRFAVVEFEWDKMLGGVEATLVILGFGVRVRHNYEETKELADLRRKISEAERNLE